MTTPTIVFTLDPGAMPGDGAGALTWLGAGVGASGGVGFGSVLLGGLAASISQSAAGGLLWSGFAGPPGGAGIAALQLAGAGYGSAAIGHGAGGVQWSGIGGGIGIGAGQCPQFIGFGNGTSIVPIVSAGAGAVPVWIGTAVGLTTPGTASGDLYWLGFAVGSAGGAGVSQAPLFAGAALGVWPAPTSWISIVQSAGVLSFGIGNPYELLRETLVLQDRLLQYQIEMLLERLALVDTPLSVIQAVAQLLDAVDFIDQIGVVWKLLLQDTAVVGGVPAPSLVAMEQVVEALTLVAGPGSAISILNLVAETLALNDALAQVAKELIGDTATFHAVLTTALQTSTTLLENLLLQAVPTGSASILALVDDTVVLGDSPTSVLQALNQLQDTVGFHLTVTIGDTTYLAWVVNTETRSAWTYENYPFNSFCEFEGAYYGAAGDGIYRLDGSTDAGVNIAARFRAGLNNLGTGKMKRLPALYLGYQSDGTLVLKVVTTGQSGDKTENWYLLTPQHAGATREGRIKIGRGLKSVYYDFEVMNVAGADFDVSALELYPMILDRRI